MIYFFKVAKEDSKLLNVDLSDIMNSWTRQMGYPLITIERVDANNIKISQKLFQLDPLSSPVITSQYKCV